MYLSSPACGALRFLDKTKNEWSSRATFQKVSGKYDMVLMDYSSNHKVRTHGPGASVALPSVYL